MSLERAASAWRGMETGQMARPSALRTPTMKYDVYMGINVVATFNTQKEADSHVKRLQGRYIGTRLGIYSLPRT